MRISNIGKANALQHELESGIEGEVRFDNLSRAMYATDASVYQIIPLGVVLYVLRDGTKEYRELWMNFYELKELVAGWNKEGRFDAATARRDVKVLDLLDKTAVARLDAEWGIDFFQLAKIDGEWKIMNVIWQTYPPKRE